MILSYLINKERFSITYAIALIFSIFSLAFDASAQQHSITLSLAQAIEMAKNENKEIQLAKVGSEIAKERTSIIQNSRFPEVELHTSYARVTNLNEYQDGLFNSPEMVKSIPELYDVTMNAKMPLFMGNKINNEIKKSDYEHEIANLKVNKTTDDIQLNVIAVYLGTYKLMLFSKVLKEQIKEEENRLNEVKALKKNGALTKNDLLRAEVQLSNMNLALINNNANISIGIHRLKTLLEIPEAKKIEIDTVATVVNLPNKVFDHYLNTIEQKDEMLIAEKEIAIADVEQKITKGNYYPKIALFGTYGYNYPNYKFFPPTPYLYTLGLGGIDLSFSLSELFKNKRKMTLANKHIEQQHIEAEVIKNELVDKLYKEFKQYEASKEKVPVTEKTVEQATENYRIVKMKYLNQLALITDMIDADNAMLEAKFTNVSAIVDAQINYYSLQHAAGTLN